MKVAVSSTGKKLESAVDGVFGRCAYFIIAEVENGEIKGFEAMKNTYANQPGGAGISAAQAVVDKGAEAIISGNLGPRAKDVLNQFRVEVYNAGGTVKEALEMFMKEKK